MPADPVAYRPERLGKIDTGISLKRALIESGPACAVLISDARDIVLSHSGMDTSILTDIAAHALSERGRIYSGSVASPVFISAPHQILCASDGRVICTNTGRNAISVIDLERPGQFHEARLPPSRWDKLSHDNAGDHLNSLFEKEGKPYVLAHGHARGWMLAIFSYPDLQPLSIQDAGRRTGMHNIWVTEDGEYVACHSQAGTVVDLASDKTLWQSGNEVFTRGPAASAEVIVVGESQKTGIEFSGPGFDVRVFFISDIVLEKNKSVSAAWPYRQ